MDLPTGALPFLCHYRVRTVLLQIVASVIQMEITRPRSRQMGKTFQAFSREAVDSSVD